MALVRRRGRTLDCSTRPGRNSSCTGSSRNRPTRVRMEASVKGARSRWVLRGRPKPPRRLDKLGPSHGSHLGVKGIDTLPAAQLALIARCLPPAAHHGYRAIGSLHATSLKKRPCQHDPPFSRGLFAGRSPTATRKVSLKGLCRMTNPCGVSHGQMAKVEPIETV